MLTQRLRTSAVGIPIITAVIFLDGAVYTSVVAGVLALAIIEFCAIAEHPTEQHRLWHPTLPAGVAAVAIVIIVAILDANVDDWPANGSTVVVLGAAVTLGFVMAPVVTQISSRREVKRWALAGLGLVYIGCLGVHFIPLRDLANGEEWVLLAIIGTWATDTFAYAFGRAIGKRKLAPKMSPGKTKEGTAAGIIGGFASVFAIAAILDLPMSTGEALFVAITLPPLAILGDLLESWVKRKANVKDTSALLPGHGGVLDRLDSLLLTVPLVYWFAALVVL